METVSKQLVTNNDTPLDGKMRLSSEETLMALILNEQVYVGMKVIIGSKLYIMRTDVYTAPEELPGASEEWKNEWEQYFAKNWIINDIGTVDGGEY